MGNSQASCASSKSIDMEHQASGERAAKSRRDSRSSSWRCVSKLKILVIGDPCVGIERMEDLSRNGSCNQGLSKLRPSSELWVDNSASASNVKLIDAMQAKKIQMKSVKRLIREKADVNGADRAGNTPLILAVQLGNLALVKILLTSGASLNIADSRNGTALYYAVISGQCALAAKLVQAGSDVNYSPQPSSSKMSSLGMDCCSPMAAAIHRKCDACFQLLLDNGADINMVDSDNRAPLVHALSENPWSQMSYPTPGDLQSFETRSCGQLPRSFASLETGSSILHRDRIRFACRLLERGADEGLLKVWERILWAMWCRSPFDHDALELCIRAVPLTSLREREASTPGPDALFRSLLYHGMGRHLSLMYASGINPSVPKATFLFDSSFKDWLVKVGSSPRTLQSACVVTIRHCMAGRGNVIHKTNQLVLPEKLKRMITLDLSAL